MKAAGGGVVSLAEQRERSWGYRETARVARARTYVMWVREGDREIPGTISSRARSNFGWSPPKFVSIRTPEWIWSSRGEMDQKMSSTRWAGVSPVRGRVIYVSGGWDRFFGG
jgi:hypothetical protein